MHQAEGLAGSLSGPDSPWRWRRLCRGPPGSPRLTYSLRSPGSLFFYASSLTLCLPFYSKKHLALPRKAPNTYSIAYFPFVLNVPIYPDEFRNK